MWYDVLLVINLVVLLYVWFDTDAFPEWAGLLRLKFLKYKEFALHKQGVVPMFASHTYPEFLSYKYGGSSFLIRLITCPICFTVWCNIALLCVFHSKVELLWLGPNIILSWLGYHSLRWILKVFNA